MKCCGNCKTYREIKWPGGIIECCADIIPSDNKGCDDYEPEEEANHEND